MSKEREKVKCKTELEFITEVADDCVANLKDKDREHLIRNPYAIDYHFSYCLYIRNHYIHNRDFSDVDFWTEPDDLSSEIIRMIFAKLIPEYDYDNQFIENLFDDKRFIQLRQEYRAIYGDYPVAMVEEYKEGISFEPALFMSEISSSNNVDIDKEIEVSKKNHEKSCAHIEKLLKKLAEKVWRLDQLRQTAEEYGIDYEELIPKIQEIQKILFEDREYIPVEVCLLPYKKAIGQKRYIEYRRRLQQIEAKDFYQSFEREERISAKEFFTDGTAILVGDPMPDKSVEQMQLDIASISSTQELVDVYVQVHNKFWYIEDDLYDYEEESEEYIRVKEIVEAWGEIMDLLDKKIMVAAKKEGLLAERQLNSGTVKQLESFMKKYGYKDGDGWWIKLE